jgi:hypothetical protein
VPGGNIVTDELDENVTEIEPGTEPASAAETELEAPEEQPVDVAAQTPPQYGVGPFSIREVALTGVWLVAFIVSFFSVSPLHFESVWTAGLTWILTIAVPTAAVFLVVLRRLSPDGIRRVGSLGIDQFASVAFSVSAVTWLTYMWETIAFAIDGGPWIRSWVMWVEFVLMLAGVVLTVGARFIPVLCEDFEYRPEIAARPHARPLRPVAPRPAPVPRIASEKPEPAPDEYRAYDEPAQPETAYAGEYAGAPVAAAAAQTAVTEVDAEWAPQTRTSYEPAEAEPVRQQAFWVLAPEERDVVDESGTPIFRIGPSAWALAVEDRGESLVIRDEDRRIGYLHDLTGVTRG